MCYCFMVQKLVLLIMMAKLLSKQLNINIVKFIDGWPTLMAALVLEELIAYHKIEALTFIDLYSYYKI